MNKMKLFCFPYAGGSSLIYSQWKQYLDAEIELVPIELAGRGRRIQDSLYSDLDAAVEDVFQLIKNDIEESTYAFFGHSLGSMIAYELAQKIRDNKLPEPQNIFFSGRNAPHIKRPIDKKYHLLDDDEFKSEVLKLGGTPPEFFEHQELLELFLPVLKNDFKLADTETHLREIRPFQTNITVLFGEDDELTIGQHDAWKQHTTGSCDIHYFEGGHFFLHDYAPQIVKIINTTCLSNIELYI